MTIEEEFFKAFGIEEKCQNFRDRDQGCEECVADYIVGCKCDAKYFPSITAERLLKLICVNSEFVIISFRETTIEQIKNSVLQSLINMEAIRRNGYMRDREIVYKVQAVFEERLTEEYYKISQECSDELL